MPTTRELLRSPAVHHVASATTAGLLTLARPGRLPRWARRTLRLANTAGTIASLYLAGQEESTTPTGPEHADGRIDAASVGPALAAATSSVGLLTSGVGIAVDRKVEALLVRKGLKHPRVWMAVGVAGVVLAAKTAQSYAGKHTDLPALAARQKQALAHSAQKAGDAVAHRAQPAAGESTDSDRVAPGSAETGTDDTK